MKLGLDLLGKIEYFISNKNLTACMTEGCRIFSECLNIIELYLKKKNILKLVTDTLPTNNK